MSEDLSVKKRIAFILKGYPRVSETFIAQEIYLLEQMGFQIDIYSMRKAREKERQPIVELIKAPVIYIPEYILDQPVDFLKASFSVALKAPANYFRNLFLAIARSFKQRDDDPIKRFLQAVWLVSNQNLLSEQRRVSHFHSHFIHAPTELTTYLSALTGLKYSISAHAKDIYTIPPETVVERVNGSELIMTCTQFNEKFLKNLHGIQQSKVHRIYHGVDLEKFKVSKKREFDSEYVKNLTQFVSVGRLVSKKGYDVILKALQKIKNDGVNFKYEIFGEGELRDDLVRFANELGLSENVVFHRTATHPQIIARLEKGGLFLSGSKQTEDLDRDGIPNTIAEAMSMEVPIVASDVSGIPELVEHLQTGYLFKENDVEGLYKQIRYALQNPEKTFQLALTGRQKVANVFNSKEWIKQCAELLGPYQKSSKRPRVFFYCQYLLGLGHLTRSLALCESLSEKFDIKFVLGGPPIDRKIRSANIEIAYLEPLLMHESDSSLYSPKGLEVEQVFVRRQEQIEKILQEPFDIFLTELYPFGRRKFRKEIHFGINLFRQKNSKGLVVSSLRDILVESNDEKKDQSMVSVAQGDYDLVLVHADPQVIKIDETFPLAKEISDKLNYTGFVTESVRLDKSDLRPQRKPEVLISLGGGSVGDELFEAVFNIVDHFPSCTFRFKKSPYLSEGIQKKLQEMAALKRNIRIEPFSQDFESELRTVALSISMGGYNTVMNVLNTKTPALVYAYDANHEQELRARLLEKRGYLRLLTKQHLASEPLLQLMREQIESEYPAEVLNLEGGQNSMKILELEINKARGL